MLKLFQSGKKTHKMLAKIALIIFDFDGVFTDNRVIVDETGKEAVICNRSDGLGVRLLHDRNIAMLILSTETNPVVAQRAGKLRLECIQGVSDKKAALLSYCNEKGINIKNVMYVGNDLNDYEAMQIVGFPVAPGDAHPKIRALAKTVLYQKGGEGAIAELAERLIWE